MKGGGDKAIEKVRAEKKLSPLERITGIFDPGTFREMGLWARPMKTGFDIDKSEVPRDALIIGYGRVNGRTVYASCHDSTVLGGSQAAMQFNKLGRVMQQARDEGVPYVGIVDSGGRRIQDLFGRWSYRAPVRVRGLEEGAVDMFCPPMASGVIPQITIVLGYSVAGTAYSPVMADFVFFRKKAGYMAVASPQLLKSVTYQDVTWDQIGGAELHATTTGTCDVLVESDEEALMKCRDLLSYLPSNWTEKAPRAATGDPAARTDPALNTLLDASRSYDVHGLIRSLVDDGKFFEIFALYATSLVIGYGRLAGQPVGIVANNPAVRDGALDANTCDKAARFVRTCDAFNIPLLFLVDTPGFVFSRELEQSGEGLSRHAAKPAYAICESTVPKISVYLGRCYGAGRLVMGTREMGIDAAFAWPTAEIRLRDTASLARQVFSTRMAQEANQDEALRAGVRQLETDYKEPYASGGLMSIDDIIEPAETRPILINTLARLAKKMEPERPWKKHDLIPL